MKKLVAMLVLMLMALPAFAINEITITAVDSGSGVLSVYYNVDPASETDPVGIALGFACSDAATTTSAGVTAIDPCFPVYLDFAHDAVGPNFDPCTWDPCNPLYEVGDGNPLAKTDEAGVPAGAVSAFSVCMGRLDQPAPTKGVAHKLCDIQLAQGSAAFTDVTIAADSLRGGVVGSVFTVNVPGAPVRVNFGVATFNLTTSVVGGIGGTIAPASGPQPANSVVNLVATPSGPSYSVKAWTGVDSSSGNTATVTMTGDKTVTVEFWECLKITAPEYNTWAAWGKPDCWCYDRQCRGNVDGKKTFLRYVSSTDLDLFKQAYNKTDSALALVPNGMCANLDHAKTFLRFVSSTDLDIFKTYYNKTDASVPVCPMTNINFWKVAP